LALDFISLKKSLKLGLIQIMIMMKFKNSVIANLLAVGVFVFIASCGDSKKEDTTNESAEFDQAKEELKGRISGIIEEIPDPSEVPFILESTGADFNSELPNDKSKVDSYKTVSRIAALNLGIYGADIGYLSSYEKSQESLEYLTVCKELADQLNVTGAFEQEIIERFESNLSVRDSLASILNEAIKNANDFLQDDDRNQTGALILTGSVIEGLYLSTGVVMTYPSDILPEDSKNLILTPLIRTILDQEKAISDVIEMLETVNDGGSEDELIASIQEIKGAYERLDIQDQLANNHGGLVLTDDALVEISEKVSSLRNDITK
jgi:hypothetical protein